ncbi:hypothetical protein, partial [Enterobacter ludwigii]|uniref:hypothetical protein n=1 Tax=Enterobacter ludwigii TaxID=299767 RepID=UPI00195350C0
VTHRFNADPERVAKAERDADEVQGVDWFGAFPDVELYEEVVGLGRYGRTLTVITTVDALPDEEDDSADSDHDGRW